MRSSKFGVYCVAFLAVAAPIGTASAQCGKASWYHEGSRTATGERYRPDGITAAHRTLPFGTIVQVTHQRTGRTVNVRINDRGPFIRGRIIDLSRGAKRVLGMDGVAPVCISVAGRGGNFAEADTSEFKPASTRRSRHAARRAEKRVAQAERRRARGQRFEAFEYGTEQTSFTPPRHARKHHRAAARHAHRHHRAAARHARKHYRAAARHSRRYGYVEQRGHSGWPRG